MTDDVADFEASRQAALTQRMRYAKAQGQVPLWPIASVDEMPPDEPMQPLAQQPPAQDEKSPPAAGTDASAASIMSQASLTIGLLAVVAAIVLGIGFLTHRATYNYK